MLFGVLDDRRDEDSKSVSTDGRELKEFGYFVRPGRLLNPAGRGPTRTTFCTAQ
jgi:hypothetical protein